MTAWSDAPPSWSTRARRCTQHSVHQLAWSDSVLGSHVIPVYVASITLKGLFTRTSACCSVQMVKSILMKPDCSSSTQ